MALPLHQGQDRLPRIRHPHSRLHGHIDKNNIYSFSHLKEAVIRDRLEAILPVLHTVTVLGGWWRWGYHHFLTVLELLNLSQQLFLIVCQGPILFPSWGWARDVHATLGIPLCITAGWPTIPFFPLVSGFPV